MKKIELLAPAGDFLSLKAAIAAGCNAVYIGGTLFGARAFSNNFNDEEIIEAINYAHLYGVKVYVTVNTLVYEREVNHFLDYIDFLHKHNADAIIIQDLGMFDLVRKTFPNLDIHASTQMHIHNLDGVELMEKLGMRRVVLARETSIDDIKKIKANTDIELEVFVHGALCISYSGQCLMSSLIGGRSGNRGTCAGSCRQKYDVVDKNNNKLNEFNYPISTKDLNTIEYIDELIDTGVSSLKIEGRMKSPEYVYTVVSLYRQAIDSYYTSHKVYIDDKLIYNLKKIFNRDYTKGFIFNTSNNDLINPYRSNHQGVEIGKILDYKNHIATILLYDNICIGSGLRVINSNEDVGILVNEFYIKDKLVKEAFKGDIITIKVNSRVNINSKVLITLDSKLNKEIDNIINSNCKKILITGIFQAYLNKPLLLIINDGINTIKVSGNIVSSCKNKPIIKKDIEDKLNKLGDSIYKFSSLDINISNNVFIPLKEINDLRRQAILKLNEARLYKIPYVKNEYSISIPSFTKEKLLTCLVENKEEYNSLNKKYDVIYSEEPIPNTILKLPRVIDFYPECKLPVLVGEIGAFNKYNNVYTDFSLNVTNSYTVAFLHSLGAKRITLSYELKDNQIEEIINNYKNRYHKNPNLELIVQGYEEVMISKFSLNKYYNNSSIYLKDKFNNFYKVKDKNNIMYIYNYKQRNNYSDKYYDIGINSLRVNIVK